MQINTFEAYLGDGLYVKLEGSMIKLYASNGLFETAAVYLEPEVLEAFLSWVKRVRDELGRDV